jgi:O-antigen/teichoic acid export membrane protein
VRPVTLPEQSSTFESSNINDVCQPGKSFHLRSLEGLKRKLLDKRLLGIIDQGAISVASFLTMAAVGRIGGEAELGSYGITFTLLWLAACVPNSLVWTQFAIRVPKLNEQATVRLERSIAWHTLIFVAMMAIPTLAITLLLPNPSLSQFASSFVFIGGTLLREHVRRVLMSHSDFRTLLLIDVIPSIIQLAALAVLVATNHFNAITVMCLHGFIVGLPAWIVMSRQRIGRVKMRQVWIDFLRHWKSGRWLMGASIVGSICDASVRFAIVFLVGIVEQGRFTASFSLPLALNPLLLTLNNWLRVSIARQAVASDEATMAKRSLRMLVRFGLIGFLLFGTLGLLGEWAGMAIYGQKFSGLGPTIATVCFGLIMYLLSVPTEITLTTFGRARSLLMSNVLRLIAMSIGLVPMVWSFGALGGGLVWAGGLMVMVLYQIYQVRKIAFGHRGSQVQSV